MPKPVNRDLAERKTVRTGARVHPQSGPEVVSVERVPLQTWWYLVPDPNNRSQDRWVAIEDLDTGSAQWIERTQDRLIEEKLLRPARGYRQTTTTVTRREIDGQTVETVETVSQVIRHGGWV